MKRIRIFIFSLVVGLTAFWSCDFDTDIYTAIDMDKAFGSAQDIENALNGAYSNYSVSSIVITSNISISPIQCILNILC